MEGITEDIQIERVTTGPKHHLFGFHDLLISNKANNKYLAIEAEVINRPPLPNEKFGIGYVENSQFFKLGETTALNYPQGARQQWIADTDLFTVNNRVGNVWGTDIYDASDNKLVDRFAAPTHMLTLDGRYSLGLDYARLHRLGGYGYTGIEDSTKNYALPSNAGITITNVRTHETKLLVSVQQVAECGTSDLSGKTHHYLTHLCTNPSSTRVAFLHRYFMADGGLMTRLMTIGIDGSDLRCLGQGFLSHFDWKDDENIYIYGRVGSAIDSVRNLSLLQNPFIKKSLQFTKKTIRTIIGKQRTFVSGMTFLLISDSWNPNISQITELNGFSDGHPMTNPSNRDWCICDTYPNREGIRELFLYHFHNKTRFHIGEFKRLFKAPDLTRQKEFLIGIDENILKSISVEQIAFTRSGLHCDLHPRWSADGKFAVFDSIHEGTRQIYRANVSSIVFK